MSSIDRLKDYLVAARAIGTFSDPDAVAYFSSDGRMPLWVRQMCREGWLERCGPMGGELRLTALW